jgi:aminodeoxychorismate lyase
VARFVHVGGRLVPESKAMVPVSDRGFLFGDGVFETLRVYSGKPIDWRAHFRRLQKAAKSMGIKVACRTEKAYSHALELISANKLPESILRITLSRGSGPRGYSALGADHPLMVMMLHPAPHSSSEALRVITSRAVAYPLPQGTLKSCNRLPCVLARTEAAAAGADEALMLDCRGHVSEASSANIFWVARGRVWTPAVSTGCLLGITRHWVIQTCSRWRIPVNEVCVRPSRLKRVDGIFLTSSTRGVAPVGELDGRTVPHSEEITARLASAYRRKVEQFRV